MTPGTRVLLLVDSAGLGQGVLRARLAGQTGTVESYYCDDASNGNRWVRWDDGALRPISTRCLAVLPPGEPPANHDTP